MQATLDAFALKPFTKALTCLSRYGEDLTIRASPDTLSLAVTNSSLSAYCRFRFGKHFFSRYNVGKADVNATPKDGAVQDIRGQLLAKALLSILKHRTIEKSVERCELSITEGAQGDGTNEEEDTLESRLTVRLHCKHGIVKTHRLLLLIPTSLLAPGVPDTPYESQLTIGPKAVKDIIEHFPGGRIGKSDPQLIWSFRDSDVEVKSSESSIDAKGKAPLSTELTVSADEFDVYNVHCPPITIAFHLREFNATVAYAEAMSLTLELRFTDPAAPLYIEIEGDDFESLFVISTSHVNSAPPYNPNPAPPQTPQNNVKKRPREEEHDMRGETPSSRVSERTRKPIKAAQRADYRVDEPPSRARSASWSMPPPSMVPRSSAPHPLSRYNVEHLVSQTDADVQASGPSKSVQQDREPLFILSQLSTAEEEAVRASGLGVEHMNVDEFEAMLEGDGEEVDFGLGSQSLMNENANEISAAHADERELHRQDSLDFEDNMEFAPTQESIADGHKAFQPLFED